MTTTNLSRVTSIRLRVNINKKIRRKIDIRKNGRMLTITRYTFPLQEIILVM